MHIFVTVRAYEEASVSPRLVSLYYTHHRHLCNTSHVLVYTDSQYYCETRLTFPKPWTSEGRGYVENVKQQRGGQRTGSVRRSGGCGLFWDGL